MTTFTRLLLSLYRQLPMFRGKYRIGYRLFRRHLDKPNPITVKIGKNILYHLPNTIENIGKEIVVKGEYEGGTVRALRKELEGTQKPVFFDVGANIGAILIPLKKRLPAADIHAFEASPHTFKFLLKNCRENDISVANVHNKAVHSSHGRELTFFDSVHYGKSSLAPVYVDRTITVKSVSLDAYCRENEIACIDLLKVDVQGFELEVFRGMITLLQQKKVKTICFEFEDWAEEAAGFQSGASQAFLLKNGYQLFTDKGKMLKAPERKGSLMLWSRPDIPGNEKMLMHITGY